MPIGQVTTIMQLLQAACAILVAWRLSHFHLAGTMKAMALWQLWTAILSLGTYFLLSYYQPGYTWMFLTGIPIDAVLMVAAVREMFNMVFSRYPAIRNVGRTAMYVAVTLVVTLSYLLPALVGRYEGKKGPSYYMLIMERSTVFTLVLFILVILFFLSRYPLQLPRNFTVSCSLFCTMFLSQAVVQVIQTTSRDRMADPSLNLAQVIVSIICLICWTLLLQPAAKDTVPSVRPNVESEEELLSQLESLNRLLSGATRH